MGEKLINITYREKYSEYYIVDLSVSFSHLRTGNSGKKTGYLMVIRVLVVKDLANEVPREYEKLGKSGKSLRMGRADCGCPSLSARGVFTSYGHVGITGRSGGCPEKCDGGGSRRVTSAGRGGLLREYDPDCKDSFHRMTFGR